MSSRSRSRSTSGGVAIIPAAEHPSNESQPRFKPIHDILEERVEAYCPGGLHPVEVGDVFKQGQYEVCRKIGRGSFSTVWLAVDRRHSRYVALKIGHAAASQVSKEIAIHEHIRHTMISKARSIIKLIDHFVHEGPNGAHTCLVLEPTGPSVARFLENAPSYETITLPLWAAKKLMMQLLQALAELHSQGIAHGDVQFGNLLFAVSSNLPAISDNSTQIAVPSTVQSRPIERVDGREDHCAPKCLVESAPLLEYFHLDTTFETRLSDLGAAYFINDPPLKPITPITLRAPEQILGLTINDRTDVWSFGCLLFELLTGNTLFYIWKSIHEQENIDDHMLHLVDALGPPPITIAAHWPRRNLYFDQEGQQIKFTVVTESNVTAEEYSDSDSEDSETDQTLRGRFTAEKMDGISQEEATMIINLLSKVLVYEASKRPTARELLDHPWFHPTVDPNRLRIT